MKDDLKKTPSRVTVIACCSYDAAAVAPAVQEGMEYLGGVSAFARPGPFPFNYRYWAVWSIDC